MPDNGIHLMSDRETPSEFQPLAQYPDFVSFLSSWTWFLVIKDAISSWADGIVGNNTIENPVTDSRMSLSFHLSSRLGN